MHPINCTLCGEIVLSADDANKLYELATGDATYAHQHLMAVVDKDGSVQCPGTPSLTKYLGDHRLSKYDKEWSVQLESTIPLAYAFASQPYLKA